MPTCRAHFQIICTINMLPIEGQKYTEGMKHFIIDDLCKPGMALCGH